MEVKRPDAMFQKVVHSARPGKGNAGSNRGGVSVIFKLNPSGIGIVNFFFHRIFDDIAVSVAIG